MTMVRRMTDAYGPVSREATLRMTAALGPSLPVFPSIPWLAPLRGVVRGRLGVPGAGSAAPFLGALGFKKLEDWDG
jgi:hypothetical protein